MYKRLVTTKDGKSERILQENLCPILETCGKCTLLSKNYKEQLLAKTQSIKENLFALGKDFAHVSVKDCVPAIEKIAYRNSVHLMISEHMSMHDAYGEQKRRIDIGFYQPELRRVIDIGRCSVQTLHLNHIIAWLRTGIRIHNVSIHTSSKKDGLLESVILHSTQNAKQIFVCFVVSKMNIAQLRPLACDIAAKFSNVRGIFIKTKDDTENKNLKLLTGHAEIQENFLGLPVLQTLKSMFHPNLAMMEKIVIRVEDIKMNYGEKDNLLVVSSNPFLSTVMKCVDLDTVFKQKPKMLCLISSLSQSTKKMLTILKEHNYKPLFVEPFDVLPGTDYVENIILFSKENT